MSKRDLKVDARYLGLGNNYNMLVAYIQGRSRLMDVH